MDKQLWELVDDISLIDGADTHLFGSIVCLTGHHVAGLNKLELVDGQQRLTTISILLQCIQDRLVKEGEASEAQDIGRLLTAKALGGNPVRKIALDSLDSSEFEQLANGGTVERPQNHHLCSAFTIFRKWVNEQQLPRLGTFLYRLKNQAIIIRLDVNEAKDAFKLFEIINNRGLRLSPTDIIKNFLLGNAARFSADALALARTKWAELIKSLDGVNFETFFRQFLCAHLRRRITVSFVIANFKKIFMQQVIEATQLPERHWYLDEEESGEGIDDEAEDSGDSIDEPEAEVDVTRMSFATFMDQLVASARIFGEIVRGSTGNARSDRHLRNLRMIAAMQTYGFLMHLRVGECNDSDFHRILQLTEAFLLRRHVCRERSNENETAFARLCGVDCTNPLPEVTETYRQYSPPDERFREDFATTSFSTGLVERARYCLEQFEMNRQGDQVELLVGGGDLVHVEHIIPQKIKTKKAKEQFGDWTSYLGPNSEVRHPKYVSRIGNLSLFSGTLNIGASNNPYERKKPAYLRSAIKITNTLPAEYPQFRFDEVERRSEEFAKLAVTLWPIP